MGVHVAVMGNCEGAILELLLEQLMDHGTGLSYVAVKYFCWRTIEHQPLHDFLRPGRRGNETTVGVARKVRIATVVTHELSHMWLLGCQEHGRFA